MGKTSQAGSLPATIMDDMGLQDMAVDACFGTLVHEQASTAKAIDWTAGVRDPVGPANQEAGQAKRSPDR